MFAHASDGGICTLTPAAAPRPFKLSSERGRSVELGHELIDLSRHSALRRRAEQPPAEQADGDQRQRDEV
jgi:hypothetical protein